MKRKNVVKILYAVSSLSLVEFIGSLIYDYMEYFTNKAITSAPYSAFIHLRVLEFLIPSIILVVIANLVRRSEAKKEKEKIKKRLFYMLAFVPPIIQIIFALGMILIGENIEVTMYFLTLILQLMISYSIVQKDEAFKTVGYVALGVFTVFYLIQGFQDYLKYASTIMAIVTLVYYLFVIFLFKRKEGTKKRK